MGRKSHNKTYARMLEEGRIRANKYYNLHRTDILKKKADKYRKLKEHAEKVNSK